MTAPCEETGALSHGRHQTYSERLHDLEEGVERRVAVFSKSLVKRFSRHAGFSGKSAHASCAGNVTKRRADKRGIAILKRRFEISRNALWTVQKFRHVPSSSFNHSNLLRQGDCRRDVLALRFLGSSAKQNDQIAATANKINPVARPKRNPQFTNAIEELGITEITHRHTADPNFNASANLIVKAFNPSNIFCGLANFDHGIVITKIHNTVKGIVKYNSRTEYEEAQ